DVIASLPPGVPQIGEEGSGNYIMGRYRYCFTHCPEAHNRSRVGDESWRCSWDDVFLDWEAWKAAGKPGGFVWGVNWAMAWPGLSYVTDSPLAESWTERLGHERHEVTVETYTYLLRLICHDFQVQQLGVGDPLTQTLKLFDDE